MKIRSCFLTCALSSLLAFSSVHASKLITETNDMAHVLTYVKEGTLFVFDLDNTLIEPVQHLGSDQWFSHHLQQYLNEGLPMDEALLVAIQDLIAIQHRSDIRFVDPSIPQFLLELQQSHVSMIGLTKRNPALVNRTIDQLSQLQIDFSTTSDVQSPLSFQELNDTIFQNGIIFVGHGIEKGPALNAFLANLKEMPKQIVMIDDRMSHVENVAHAAEALHIPFVGIRYGGADEKVQQFDSKISDLQWEYFGRILSDEEALHLMQLQGAE